MAESAPASQARLNLVAILPARSSVASQQIRSAFEPHVSLRHCIYRAEFEEPASSYIIKSQSSGSRTIVNYNELPEMTLEEFIGIVDQLNTKSAWFHFEGRIPDVTLECIRYLRRLSSDIRISVEIEKPGREGLQELAKDADVVFYSKAWAQNEGYKSAEDCVQKQSELAHNASLHCCTWGQGGAVAHDITTGNIVHSPAQIPSGFQVVDTIGAGDTFIAGMLYGLLCNGDTWSLPQKLALANRLAATKVAQEGFAGLGRVLKECSHALESIPGQ